MKFVLEIELGNEAMQSAEEVSAAIEASLPTPAYTALRAGESQRIWDRNGNTVGRWEVKTNAT